MDKEVADKVSQVFLSTIIEIKDKTTARRVLTELLSKSEMVMLSKRLAIVYLLEKDYSQREISKVLKVSLTTVSKMNTVTQDELGLHKIIRSMLAEEEIRTFFTNLDGVLSRLLIPKIGRRRRLTL
jgi:Trp operon repressor